MLADIVEGSSTFALDQVGFMYIDMESVSCGAKRKEKLHELISKLESTVKRSRDASGAHQRLRRLHWLGAGNA